jgi:hypothetical protein
MELPRDPTIVPQARRYSRTFSAIQGKAFRERDQIVVEIPRIDRTYLSKNVKLYFDFDLSYREASQTTLQSIFSDLKGTISPNVDAAKNYASTFFGYQSDGTANFTKISTTNPAYAYTKPIPTFDINGAYGLINRIQVFSYLNNTLLEDVQEHDLLTAQFADFWLQKENIDVNRPYMADTATNYDYQNPMRKQPCANIFHQGSSVMVEPFLISSFAATTTTSTIVPATRSVTLKCELDLFSFLGRFSDKFVPLHNGFKVVFTLSKFTDCIKFNTLYGENTCYYRRYLQGYKVTGNTAQASISITINSTNDKLALVSSYDPTGDLEVITIPSKTYTSIDELANGIKAVASQRYSFGTSSNKLVIASGKPFYVDFELTTCEASVGFGSGVTTGTDSTFAGYTSLDPTITSASISNLYIKGDLLEVSPEMDNKVDKMVYFQSYKYQKDFFPYEDFSSGSILNDGQRENFQRRILPDLKSITKVFVGQRPVVYPSTSSRQQLGYRIKNYTKGGRLLYNKAEVCNIANDQEAWGALQNAMSMPLDPYLNFRDFTLQEESSTGTDGNQMIIATQSLRDLVDKAVAYTSFSTTTYSNYNSWFAGFSGIASNSSGTTFSPYLQLSTLDQGRYLLAFDTRIPGAIPNSIAGIDSSKNVLEYEIIPEDDVCWKVNIDVFVEHDAFIHVEPGKSTSVTF